MARKFIHGALVGSSAALFALLLWSTGALDAPERLAWDTRARLMAQPGPAADRIKLILLDQPTLTWGWKEKGWAWPWPREVYTPIIDFCRRSGARCIVFDVLFSESSRYGVADDETLGRAAADSKSFIGSMFLSKTREDDPVTDRPGAFDQNTSLIDGLSPWPETLDSNRVHRAAAVFPVTEIAVGVAGLANVEEQPDPDGIFRRVNLFRIFDDIHVPSPGLAAYLVGAAGNPAMRLTGPWLEINGHRHFIDRGARGILRYRPPRGTYETFSAAAVIESELRLREQQTPIIEPSVFKDRYVFFAFSSPGLKDLRATPVQPKAPGVLIHVTLLDNLLSNELFRETPYPLAAAMVFLLSMITGIFVVMGRKAVHSVLILLILAPIPVVISFLAYRAGLAYPLVVTETGVVAAWVTGILVNYATEGRQKRFIKTAFKHYLSEAVIDRILADPSRLKLGGEKRELTIFFADLEGFSGISEKLDPRDLTALLNDYLSAMTGIIRDEEGTLDKYIGDAVVAFWNAPLDQPDHRQRACHAALRCQRELARKRETYRRHLDLDLRMRIGINTGEVIVGNMGSKERFDYSVLGDAANLASRLEGANKVFGTYTMISDSAWLGLDDRLQGRELGRIRVVGRAAPVRVFELLGFPDEAVPTCDIFQQGLQACYDQQWLEALKVFESVEEDPVAEAYRKKIRELMRTGEREWDGIWNLTSK